jgi:hypothetical protein
MPFRYILTIVIYALFFESLYAQTSYNWIGTNISTDFQNPNNWSPVRTITATDDVLSFNSLSPFTDFVVNNVPTQTIGRLFVLQGRNVTFTAQGGATRTLTLSGGIGTDFLIDTGCNLTFDGGGANPLELLFGSNVTGIVNGSITLTNTSGFPNPNHRILFPAASTGASLKFTNGAVFTAGIMVGNPFGNTGLADAVTFENGSIYNSIGGANPFGLTQPSSKVIFQTGSLYKHQQGSFPSLVGRVYGNVEFDLPGTVSIVTGGSGVCTIDNLTITQGSVSFPLTGNDSPVNISLKGNLTIASGATFNYNPTNIGATSTFTFSGSSNQTISKAGNLTFGTNSEILVNKTSPGILFLNDDVTTNGVITLNSVVNTGSSTLVITNTATGAVASNTTGHIVGKLKRSLLPGIYYNFPVGDGVNKQFVTINTDCSADYTASFNNTTPATTALVPFADGRGNFSELLIEGFWTVSSNCAGTPGYEMLIVPQNFANFPYGKPAFTIVKRSTSVDTWSKNGILSNPDNSLNGVQSDGSVRRINMSGFSDFAIAASPVTSLPLDIIYFRGKKAENKNLLEWKVANTGEITGFEIRKATDGVHFEKTGFVSASYEGNQTYFFTDENPALRNYYQLKQINKNGAADYSKVIFMSGNTASGIVEIFPNPTDGDISIELPFPEKATIQLFTMTGILLLQAEGEDELLSVQLSKKLSSLHTGVYFLVARQAGKIYHLKIQKN